MAKQTEKKADLVAYAPFEWAGKRYQDGDPFPVPAALVYDPTFDEFRNMERKQDEKLGTPFLYEVKLSENRDEETGQLVPVIDHRRVILPVEEKGE